MFRRDASGPMDVDSVHPLGRAAEYALPDDGPARKRKSALANKHNNTPMTALTAGPHSDLASPSPFATPSHTPAFRFGPNTPFLFHAPPLPPAPKFEPYDPNKWARTDFGFGTAATHVDDVDMDGGDAASGAQSGGASGAPSGVASGSAPSSPRPAKPAKAKGEKSNEAEREERKIATGAVTRARRRRRQWQKEDVGCALGGG